MINKRKLRIKLIISEIEIQVQVLMSKFATASHAGC